MTVEPMGREDVDFAVDLTGQEGWGYGPEDFLRFLRMDPGGTLLARAKGERVGITTVTAYGPVAWIGNVIVVPEARGQGYGRALMEHALDYAEGQGAEETWLNAYTHVVAFYEGLGYRATGRTGRHEGQASGTLRDEVRLAHVSELEDLAAFDAPYFGADRSKVLRAFYHDYGEAFLVWAEDGIQGYAVGARYAGGVDVAPLVADPERPDVVQGLLEHLWATHPEATFGLSVPHENERALKLLRPHGFRPAFETVRMVRGAGRHGIDPQGVVALGGLEKG